MTGAGNDFILFDNRDRSLDLTSEQARLLCDRHLGIGADGIMALVGSEDSAADFAWQFYNSDGSQAEMCGNGARCFARYVQRLTGVSGGITFLTGAGIIGARFMGDEVEVDLTPPGEAVLNQTLKLKADWIKVHSIDTGVPHAVVFVEDADQAMVGALGREIRFHTQFQPRGTNVNFVEKTGEDTIRVRTYERGVEGETLACGTGVTASALIASQVDNMVSPIQVRVQGGDLLTVSFRKDANSGRFGDVRLKGAADFVFEGVKDLD